MPLLSIKGPTEVVGLVFDFTAVLGTASILTASFSLVIEAGDPGQNLAGMLVGAPTIAGATVTQHLGAGTKGSVYRIVCMVTCNDGSAYELAADVPVNSVFGV